MHDANLDPEGVSEPSHPTRRSLRAQREAAEAAPAVEAPQKLTRRQIRERERAERLENAFGTKPVPTVAVPAEAAPTETAPTATARAEATPAAPAAANIAAKQAPSVSIRNHVSYQQRATNSIPASGLQAPVGAPSQEAPQQVSAVRGNIARVLSAESLFDVDFSKVAKPLTEPNGAESPETGFNETGPQPRIEGAAPKPKLHSDPEVLRKARAHTLRGRRPVVEPEPTPDHSRRRGRRSGAVLRKVAAGGILLVASAFVVATTVPVTQATQNQGGTGPLAVADSQSLTVSASAVQAGLVQDGALGINDALASARMSEADIAQVQAIADTDAVAGTYWTSVGGYEQALELMNTSYVQSPFPHMENVPITSPFESRWGTFHEGLDFGPGAGTEIRPVANGIVSHVMQGVGAGGYMVTVDHIIDGKRVQTGYAHMQAGSIDVREGQVVTIDTVLGNVGSTGFSTGPHLHLEVRTAEVVLIDPYRWLHDRSEVSQANWTSIDVQ